MLTVNIRIDYVKVSQVRWVNTIFLGGLHYLYRQIKRAIYSEPFALTSIILTFMGRGGLESIGPSINRSLLI